MTVQNQEHAIILRREGYSYADIAHKLKVSRATVCTWVKNVRLTSAEKELLNKNIQAKIERGRMKAKITLRTKKVFKEKTAYESAEKEFEKMVKDPFFMLGIGMWGFEKPKKNKTSFIFTASTQESLMVMQKWVQKYLSISPKRLKIRVFKGKTVETSAFTISTMAEVRRLISWQKLTILYYS
jgi:hypothetical protein